MAWKQILVKADPQPPLGLLIDFKRKGRNPYKVYRLLADLERQPFRMADNTTEDLTFDDFLQKIKDREISIRTALNAISAIKYSLSLSDEEFANSYGMDPDDDNMIDEEIRSNYDKLVKITREIKSGRTQSRAISPKTEEKIRKLLDGHHDEFIEYVKETLERQKQSHQGTTRIERDLREWEKSNHKLIDYVQRENDENLTALFTELGFEVEQDEQLFTQIEPELALAYLNRLVNQTRERKMFIPVLHQGDLNEVVQAIYGGKLGAKKGQRVTPTIEYFLMNPAIGGEMEDQVDMGRKRSNAEGRVIDRLKTLLTAGDEAQTALSRAFKRAANNQTKFKEQLKDDEVLATEYANMVEAQVYSIPSDVHEILSGETITRSQLRKLKDSEFSNITHGVTRPSRLNAAITSDMKEALGRMKEVSNRFYLDLKDEKLSEDKEILKPLFAATIEHQAQKMRKRAERLMATIEIGEKSTKNFNLGRNIYEKIKEEAFQETTTKTTYEQLIVTLEVLEDAYLDSENIYKDAIDYFQKLKLGEEDVDEAEKKLVGTLNAQYDPIKTAMLEQIKNKANNVIAREGKYEAYPQMRQWLLDNRVV